MARRRFSIEGAEMAAPPMEPGLYVVATPIGNLGDVTLRALQTLAAVDLIACEDTRVTAKLLQRYAIDTPRKAYHEHNAARVGAVLLDDIANGKAVALVSDAGTPLVSDPGQRLVADARARGLAVHAIPGASSPIAALSASGLPCDRFTFFGFLPAKRAQRQQMLEAVKPAHGTAIFFESANRLTATLEDVSHIFGGEHTACVAREITKLHEEIRLAPIEDLLAGYKALPPKGEMVLLLAPISENAIEDIDNVLRDLLFSMSVSRAAGEAAKLTGRPKRELYQRALQLADGSDG